MEEKKWKRNKTRIIMLESKIKFSFFSQFKFLMFLSFSIFFLQSKGCVTSFRKRKKKFKKSKYKNLKQIKVYKS